ncbi:uncharacterized protein C8Q71DRAFT_259164 [Rhodofomes roseus]|uniref:Uncharacterized protein n=1 Tax=Rhodofomes roseus TaxID=34475 RepID=A0ABQ8K649_9APHY|nr:uncharacterized protein C8Q71DRAFT_259164 [Rhodofomes roseus]KAH9832564.1 hypothetical protein C8Q71DRAFT_259164 [Rhodofomes roseus]
MLVHFRLMSYDALGVPAEAFVSQWPGTGVPGQLAARGSASIPVTTGIPCTGYITFGISFQSSQIPHTSIIRVEYTTASTRPCQNTIPAARGDIICSDRHAHSRFSTFTHHPASDHAVWACTIQTPRPPGVVASRQHMRTSVTNLRYVDACITEIVTASGRRRPDVQIRAYGLYLSFSQHQEKPLATTASAMLRVHSVQDGGLQYTGSTAHC